MKPKNYVSSLPVFLKYTPDFISIDLTEAHVRKELLEDISRLVCGEEPLHKTGHSSFLVLGLDLEESQCMSLAEKFFYPG